MPPKEYRCAQREAANLIVENAVLNVPSKTSIIAVLFSHTSIMTVFPITRVERTESQSVEPLGSKPKFWFRKDNRHLLFKAEARGTGEDWAEVVACHLCELVGIPHVDYQLAAEYDCMRYIRPGVICENMARGNETLVLGNQLLLAVDPNYPTIQRFRVRQHTVDAICDVLAGLHSPAASWTASAPDGLNSATDFFLAYVMLDAWIANQDRHHENWGALFDGQLLRLAPTFDHGAALARNLSDSERTERLTTRDENRTLSAFVARGRSALYDSPADRAPMGLREAFWAFAHKAPRAAEIWLRRLRAVQPEAMRGILENVPTDRMSKTCKQFVLELLLANQQRLFE